MRKSLVGVLTLAALLGAGCGKLPEKAHVLANTYSGTMQTGFENKLKADVKIRSNDATLSYAEGIAQKSKWASYKIVVPAVNIVLYANDDGDDGTFESVMRFPIDDKKPYDHTNVVENINFARDARNNVRNDSHLVESKTLELTGEGYRNHRDTTPYAREDMKR
jgi:hypothetical protein